MAGKSVKVQRNVIYFNILIYSTKKSQYKHILGGFVLLFRKKNTTYYALTFKKSVIIQSFFERIILLL